MLKYTVNQKLSSGEFFRADEVIIRNELVHSQINDPHNPVAFGYETRVIVGGNRGWSLSGPNFHKRGIGSQSLILPAGIYEITLDPDSAAGAQRGDHQLGG